MGRGENTGKKGNPGWQRTDKTKLTGRKPPITTRPTTAKTVSASQAEKPTSVATLQKAYQQTLAKKQKPTPYELDNPYDGLWSRPIANRLKREGTYRRGRVRRTDGPTALCHINAINAYLAGMGTLVTGYGRDKNTWSDHSWIEDENGRIIELTDWNPPEYFGIELTDKEARSFIRAIVPQMSVKHKQESQDFISTLTA